MSLYINAIYITFIISQTMMSEVKYSGLKFEEIEGDNNQEKAQSGWWRIIMFSFLTRILKIKMKGTDFIFLLTL